MKTKKIIFFINLLAVLAFFISQPAQTAAPLNQTQQEDKKHCFRELEVWVTAYSSSFDETDETPFITASGKYVFEGLVAANFLSFGTKIKIPELFGERIFVVEDRMHERKHNFIDIWMPTKEMAKNFGIVKTKIQILFD